MYCKDIDKPSDSAADEDKKRVQEPYGSSGVLRQSCLGKEYDGGVFAYAKPAYRDRKERHCPDDGDKDEEIDYVDPSDP